MRCQVDIRGLFQSRPCPHANSTKHVPVQGCLMNSSASVVVASLTSASQSSFPLQGFDGELPLWDFCDALCDHMALKVAEVASSIPSAFLQVGSLNALLIKICA